jgi:hypothetical protein
MQERVYQELCEIISAVRESQHVFTCSQVTKPHSTPSRSDPEAKHDFHFSSECIHVLLTASCIKTVWPHRFYFINLVYICNGTQS